MWKAALFVIIFGIQKLASQNLPNIILIIADDGGWNDFGFHGSNQYPTPNIDALAYSGVILNNHYAESMCTPSRTALLTARYPYKLGMNNVVDPSSDYGLPLNQTLLPEYFKQKGYVNRLIGKWHLGFCSEVYTPTFRGFDSFYGLWGGSFDYYAHDSLFDETGWRGNDLRRDMDVEWGRQGEYFTTIIGEESVSIVQNHNTSEPLFLMVSFTAVHAGNTDASLQAPNETIEQFYYIDSLDRRIYAAMTWEMDVAVGKLFEALDQKQMLGNSIILFSSDNGGAAAGANTCGGYNVGSNWPLRGEKCTPWEAGVRVSSFLWSPLLRNPGRVSHQMVHIVDWMPTLHSAAGGGILPDDIDGIDMWSSLVDGSQSPREEVLIDINNVAGSGSVRVGDWKLIVDSTSNDVQSVWIGDSGRNETSPEQSWDQILEAILNSTTAQIVLGLDPNAYDNIEELRANATVNCGPIPSNATAWQQCTSTPCLFNVVEDPCEYFDRSQEEPLIYQALINKLQQYNQSTAETLENNVNEESNPIYWNDTWNNWMDYPSPLVSGSP